MGLIKAFKNAFGSAIADQYGEYFYCDSISSDILVVKGLKRLTPGKNQNNGTDNIISNGSVVAVNEGQCMIIVDQGKVVELCAEAGEFIYDSSTEPSIFYGNLGENIMKTFATIGRRTKFGGNTGKDQRIYYFNTKEILNNLFGTSSPVPFRVVDSNIGLDVDIALRCNGEYTYKIIDPLLFYTNVCGNVVSEYRKSELASQLKGELVTALQPAFATISAQGVRYSAVVAHSKELTLALNEELSEQWSRLRGIEMVSMTINVKASEEDEEMIKNLQKTAVFRQTDMAAANLSMAQAEAMKSAAANTSTGPMMAFAGMNMANMVGGMDSNTLFAMGQKNTQPTKPADAGWTCTCGQINKGKFCMECGAKKPEGAPIYKCDKCGYEPANPANPPKFCPECGDAFDDNDKQ